MATTTSLPVTMETDDFANTTSVPPGEDCLSWKANPSITQSIIFFSLAAITISSNLLLVLVIARTKHLQRKSNFFVASMAVADLFQGLISEMAWGFQLWISDPGYIKAALFVTLFSTVVSVWHVFAISTERLLAVRSPIAYRTNITRERLIFISGIIWVLGLFFATLNLTVWHDQTFYLFLTWMGIVLVVAVAIMHVFIGLTIRRSRQSFRQKISGNSSAQPKSSSENAARMRENRMNKLMALIVGMFAIFQIPCLIAENLVYFGVICQKTKNTVNLLMFLSSFVNPIIYAFRVPAVNVAVKEMLCCFSKGRKTASLVDSSNSNETNETNVRMSGS